MEKILLVMDTDGIKNYVFGTNKLRDIRGASAILDELNRIVMPEIVKEKTNNNYTQIYSNGGVGEFVVPLGAENEIIEAVSNAYNENGASVTCCSVPLPMNFDFNSTNSKLFIEQLAYKMQLEKSSKRIKPAFSNPLFRFCDICQIENASIQEKNEEAIQYICRRCSCKREKFKQIKAKTSLYLKAKPDFDQTLRSNLIEKLQALKYPLTSNTKFPDEINEIESSGENYIALIYADGNDMHRRIKELDTLGEHQTFSNKIEDALFTAITNAINKYLPPKNDIFPFDILLLGGDDLILVCQAKQALSVAIEICERFYAETAEFSLSIGIAFAHANFPIRMLLRVTENLLKVAKKERAQIIRYDKMNDTSKFDDLEPYIKARIPEFREGSINFMTISSSSTLLYEDYYKKTLTSNYGNETFLRTLRPFSPAQLKRLLDIGLSLKKSFPKSKLEYLGDALFTEKFSSILKSLFIFTRSNKKQKELLRKLFHFYAELKALYPWQLASEKNRIYQTPVLDVLEIYRFLGE